MDVTSFEKRAYDGFAAPRLQKNKANPKQNKAKRRHSATTSKH
jgi:hypothetical protein